MNLEEPSSDDREAEPSKEEEVSRAGLFSDWTPADMIVAGLAVTVSLALLGTLFIEDERRSIQEGHSKEFVALLASILALITAHVSARRK